MIITSIGFVFQELSSFKKIYIFFATNQDNHPSISKKIFSLFPNSSEGEQTCQPLLVYQRRPIVPPLPPDHCLDIDLTFQLVLAPIRCSTRDRKPPREVLLF